MYSGCISGASSIVDLEMMLKQSGFDKYIVSAVIEARKA
jgi:hypothetical protein